MTRSVLVWILLSAVWGSTWVCIKIGLEDVGPFTLAWTRFLVALIPLVFIWMANKARLPTSKRDRYLLVVTGFLQFFINYALIYWAQTYVTSGLSAILYTTLPLFGQVIAHFHLPNERLNRYKLLGTVLGLIGVALIFDDQLKQDNTLAIYGVLGILLATLCTAYASVLVKQHLRHVDAVVITTSQIGAGLLPLMILGVMQEGNPFTMNWTMSSLGTVIYLGLFGSALTFGLLNWLIKVMDVTKTQFIPFASTIFAVYLGWVVLKETLDLRAILGGFAILAGLVIATHSQKKSG